VTLWAEVTSFLLRARFEPIADIELKIDEEIAFHLSAIEDELTSCGIAPDEARRLALLRFGNLDSVRRACRRIQLQERTMLLKIQAAISGALLIAVVVIGIQAIDMRRETSQAIADFGQGIDRLSARLAERPVGLDARPSEGRPLVTAPFDRPGSVDPAAKGEPAILTRSAADWLSLFHERPTDWRHGLALAQQIAALPPEEAWALVQGLWSDLSGAHKAQLVRPFFDRLDHPQVLDVVNIAATDEGLELQKVAFDFLRDTAFVEFSTDRAAYTVWAARNRERPLVGVVAESARAFAGRLKALDIAGLEAELQRFDAIHVTALRARTLGLSLGDVLRESGFDRTLEDILARGTDDGQYRALKWAAQIDAPEDWLRRTVLGIVEHPEERSPSVVAGACQVLGRPGLTWASRRSPRPSAVTPVACRRATWIRSSRAPPPRSRSSETRERSRT
jgi:hypothetical protein